MDRLRPQAPETRGPLSTCSVLLPAALFTLALACRNPDYRPRDLSAPSPATATTPTPDDPYAQRLQADPIACLREIFTRADALPQYRLTFYRQERLGGKLRPQERIVTLFRKEPFSVKFTWDDPDADYYESLYVAGQNNNQLVVRERKGALPLLPPTVRKVEPETAVKFNRACHPITEFGLANLVRRTLIPLEDPQARPHITIRYRGLVHITPQARPVHHLRIERPPTPGVLYIAQDFYIDPQTLLPAGADLYQPDGQLAATYRYVDLDTAVELSDADFQLSTSRGHP